MPFRFVHTADIHLDSPLRSLSLRNSELAGLIGNATRQALVAIVDLCLEEKVDALLIAGDLYDGEQTSMKTARFLATEMQRLGQAGIPVFKIRGNHDAMSRITRELTLPPTVKVFGAEPEVVEIAAGGVTIAIQGLSFRNHHAPESLLPRYRPPVAGAVNIGLMHTSLAGSAGHDLYAPCAIADLMQAGFEYWALGHIHQRTHHAGPRTVVMPGMPQGRDINEAGPKTVSLVTIGDDHSVSVEERLTSVAEFQRLTVDVSTATDWRDLVSRLGKTLEAGRTSARSEHLVARLRLTGATPLGYTLRRDLDLLLGEAEQRAEGVGKTWIDKIELAVSPPAAAVVTDADPVLELDRLMREDVMPGHGFREDLRETVQDILDYLPPEARHFAGNSDDALDSFLDRLLAESGDDILARLKSAGHGDA